MNVSKGPGLKRMRAATPKGLCPFCLDPIPPPPENGDKPLRYCGDPVCLTAYHRTSRRDRRRRERAAMQALQENEIKAVQGGFVATRVK